MRTPASRVGVLITIGATIAVLWGLHSVVREALKVSPPPRAEFIEKINQDARKRGAEELSCRLDWSKCPERVKTRILNADTGLLEYDAIYGRVIDPGASWNRGDRARMIAGEIEDAIVYQSSDHRQNVLYWGARALLAGLFLWLAWDITVIRAWRWIRYGSTT